MAALSPNVRAEVPGAYLALLERFLGAL
jgi:hypothetical protein